MIAEIFSIYKALVWVKNTLQPCKIVVLSDSRAAILSLQSDNTKNRLVFNCLHVLRQLFEQNYDITLQWIPSHVGLPGNEKADENARQAIQLPLITPLSPCYKDILNLIRRENYTLLQNHWHQMKSNEFLGNNKPDWGIRNYDSKTDRKTEVIINRLRVGKTLLNKHAYRINISNSPNCVYCNVEEDIDHFILHCYRYHSLRTNLINDLNKIKHNLGNSLSIPLLLGGGDFDDNIKNNIHRCLINFVRGSYRKI